MRWKLLASALLLSLTASVSHAQSLIIVSEPEQRRPVRPMPRPIPRPRPPRGPTQIQPIIKSQTIEVSIEDQLAVTTVTQVFYNPHSSVVEGKYIFPIPRGATISQFSMWMNGKEMQGELLDSKKARSVYEGIVRKMRDPALLEFLGQGIFQARIFPINGHSTQKVKLTYSQAIETTRQRCAYQYALNSCKLNRRDQAALSVSVKIKNKTAIAGIFSPSHDVVISRKSDHEVLVSYETTSIKGVQPFQLHYDIVKSDIGLTARSFQKGTKDGFVMITLNPNPNVKQAELPAKDVVFVLDTSGSMAGDDMKGLRLKQAQKALKSCINYLSEKDRFNIVAFSMEAREFKEGMVAANAANKAEAFEFIDEQKARGATALNDALNKTLAMQSAEAKRPFNVVVISDGKPTFGETDEKRILKNIQSKLKNARIFTLGIGTEVNSRLLDSIAVNSRGDREYVLDDEEIEFKIASFYDKFAFPVLANCQLKIAGVEVFDCYPKKLPDLFKGQSLTVFGRYKKGGKATLTLTGQVGDKAYSKEFSTELVSQDAELKFLPTLWASRKISVLLEQIRLNGEHKELRDEVVKLAKKYGIPTPYTSYLVVEDAVQSSPSPRGDGRLGQQSFGGAEKRRKRAEGLKGASEELEDMSSSAPAPRADGTGRGNIEESIALKKLSEGKIDKSKDASKIRRIGQRTFYQQKNVWLENGLKLTDKAGQTLKYLSPEYFEFVKANPDLAKVLAIGSKLKFKLNDKIIEIVDES